MHFDRTDLIEPIYFRDSLSQYFTFPPVNTCTVEYRGKELISTYRLSRSAKTLVTLVSIRGARNAEWSRSTRETAPLVANKSGPNKTVAWTVVPASGVLLHGGGAVVGKKKLLGTKVRVVWPL